MSRPQQYTDDLRLAHILADSVDRVSAMRFRDRPAFSPASEVVEPAEAAPAAAPLAPWQQATQQPAEPQAPVQELQITPRVWPRRLRSFCTRNCRVCVLVTVLPVRMPAITVRRRASG